MPWSRRGEALARRERARQATEPAIVDVVLDCGHETREPPVVRFSDGRERFACADCGGRLRREKGRR